MAKQAPRVSVVVPCYNLGVYVKDAIESVISQSLQDFEVIVVDDGSTDAETIKILDGINEPKVSVLHIKNRGLAGARNYGVSKSSGNYIVCLDADDMLAPEYLRKTAAVLDKDTAGKLGFVATWLREFGVRDNLWKAEDFNIPKLLINNVVHAG